MIIMGIIIAFNKIKLTIFGRHYTFWTMQVVFILKHTTLSQLLKLYSFNYFSFINKLWPVCKFLGRKLLFLMHLISILKIVWDYDLVIINKNIVNNINLPFTVIITISILNSQLISYFWGSKRLLVIYHIIFENFNFVAHLVNVYTCKIVWIETCSIIIL